MKKKKWLFILLAVSAAFAALLHLLLWNSSGNIIDFIAGQMEPSPKLGDRGISLKGGAGLPLRFSAVIESGSPAGETDPEYLSFAIDTSQVVGGKWWNPRADVIEMGGGEKHAPVFDFNRPRLDILVKALTPAYLRIGGTEADKTYYDMDAAGTARADAPAPYKSVMTRPQWDNVNAFARRNGLPLVMTLNTGPSSRRSDGSWNPENAEKLIAYSAGKGYRVSVWELGNELNLNWYDSGPRSQVDIGQYLRDLTAAKKLVKKYYPEARFTGHSSAFWPILGEPLGFFFGMMEDYVRVCGRTVDSIGWHYYPQQSRRGPIASRKAFPSTMLDPDSLDEAAHWASYIGGLRDAHAPGTPIWLGETGNAQFGGEPGVSDAYIGGLWWLDQLGLLAKNGVKVVVRQTLSGMNYGMIDPESLVPNPDYWNSLLWKRLMGRKAYNVNVSGDGSRKLRIYAHSGAPGSRGEFSALVINLNHDRNAVVSFPAMKGRSAVVYAVNTPDILGTAVLLNGKKLEAGPDGSLPPVSGKPVKGKDAQEFEIRPLSYIFVVFMQKK